VPSVLHSVNKPFTECRTLPSATLSKVFFAECPKKALGKVAGTRQRAGFR
jgi:hypothetical protein